MTDPASLETTADKLYDLNTVLLCQVCGEITQPSRDEILTMLQSGNSRHCRKPMMLTSADRAAILRGIREKSLENTED